jgi:hypothetical protein
MKTTILAAFAALFVLASAAIAAPEIRIHGASAKSGGLTEAQVRTQPNVSLVSTAEVGAITAPAFGFEAVAMDGNTPVNGTWALTSLKYTLRINGAVALGVSDGLPILDRQMGTFNDIGGATPCIRGLNTASVESVPTFTDTSNVTLTGTHSVIVAQHGVPITGTVRRPFLANPGDFYSIEYAITGSFNGVSFGTKKVTTMVVVGVATVWADLRPDGQWRNGADWVCPSSTMSIPETGFVQGVRVAPTGAGAQYVLIGWEASTDLGQSDPWVMWPSQVAGGVTSILDGSGVLNLRAIDGMSGPRRFFRLKYQSVTPVSS